MTLSCAWVGFCGESYFEQTMPLKLSLLFLPFLLIPRLCLCASVVRPEVVPAFRLMLFKRKVSSLLCFKSIINTEIGSSKYWNKPMNTLSVL